MLMANKKRRKVKIGRLLILIDILLALLIGCILILINISDKEEVFDKDISINELNYDDIKTLDLDLHSKRYMLVRLNDFKVLYGSGIYEKFYPASLTKVVTLDTVVKYADALDDTSKISRQDYEELIEENASLAYLQVDEEYSLKDLLYALVLPSGGDAGKALENYFSNNNLNLIDLMNKNMNSIGCVSSNFTNSTGLHNDNLYTTLNDYAKLVIDSLNNSDAKRILKSYSYTLDDGLTVKSTLSSLENYFDNIEIYGGKTGFTGQAGENIMILYEVNNRSFLLILSGALGNPYIEGENYHIIDAISVLKYLYS